MDPAATTVVSRRRHIFLRKLSSKNKERGEREGGDNVPRSTRRPERVGCTSNSVRVTRIQHGGDGETKKIKCRTVVRRMLL
eukprot:30980-Pelagococcus_subviridis.AAC.10